jgi:hypothetical protein
MATIRNMARIFMVFYRLRKVFRMGADASWALLDVVAVRSDACSPCGDRNISADNRQMRETRLLSCSAISGRFCAGGGMIEARG